MLQSKMCRKFGRNLDCTSQLKPWIISDRLGQGGPSCKILDGWNWQAAIYTVISIARAIKMK